MWLLGRYLLKLEADFFEEVTLHRFDCICNWGKNERKKHRMRVTCGTRIHQE